MVASTRNVIACIWSVFLISSLLTTATSALAQADFDGDGVDDSIDDCSDFDPASTSKGPSPVPAVADRTQDDYNITWIADQEIDGTAFDDQITAGDEPNVVFAGGGNDTTDAGGGDDLIYAFGVADEPDYKEIVGGTGTDVVVLSGFKQPADFCPKPDYVDVRGTSEWSGGTEYKLRLTDVEFVGAVGQRLYGTAEFLDWLGPLLSPKVPPLPPLSESGTIFSYQLGPRSSVAVDLDNDGYDEIIVATTEEGEVEVGGETYYYRPGELKIYSSGELGALSDITRSILGTEPIYLYTVTVTVSSDFNQDGYLDLFFCDSGYDPAAVFEENLPLMVGTQNLLLLSSGNGRLVDVSSSHLPQISDFCHGASSGDIDRDGDDDIWVSNLQNQFAPAVSYLLENDGTGKFKVIADVGHGSNPPGDETYLEYYPYPDQRLPSSLWNESFTEGTSVAWWSSMIDATGDGADEIIMWSAYSTAEGHPPIRDVLLINDGNGFFTEAMQGAIPEPIWGLATSSEGSGMLDVNGDGRDDIFVQRIYGDGAGAYQLLINNGDGTFSDETSSRMPGVEDPSLPGAKNYSNLRVVDIDSDGDEDLSIVIDFVSTYFVNDGTGHFTQQITIPELPFWHQPIDLKADGRMDLVAQVSWGNDREQQALGAYLNLNTGTEINAGHAGAWFNPATSGQGQLIDIEPESEFMFLAWFAYTEDDSENPNQQHWFTAQGNYSGNQATLPVYETLGGKFDDPAEVTSTPVGTIELEFDDCANGQASYAIDSWETTGSFPLTRVIPGTDNVCLGLAGGDQSGLVENDGRDGAWYDPATPGQGFLIDVHPNAEADDFIFVAWFTYGEGNASGQRWLTAQGPLSGTRADIAVYETTGGSFDDPTAVSSEEIGTMSIQFTDCSSAQLSYDLTAEGRSGAIDIIRVIPGTEALCEELDGIE